jgi:hypothetical protein
MLLKTGLRMEPFYRAVESTFFGVRQKFVGKSRDLHQGCQILLVATYQSRGNIPKDHKTCQRSTKVYKMITKLHQMNTKIHQMTKLFFHYFIIYLLPLLLYYLLYVLYILFIKLLLLYLYNSSYYSYFIIFLLFTLKNKFSEMHKNLEFLDKNKLSGSLGLHIFRNNLQ